MAKRKRCGAKAKSTGKPCRRLGMANGRCRFHGGKSTGPKDQKGNKNGITHGIYSRGLRPDEAEIWQEIDIGSLDDEIRLVKIQIRRAFEQLTHVEDSPANQEIGFELYESRVESHIEPGGGGQKSNGEKKSSGPKERRVVSGTRRRPDYRDILQRLIGRLTQLYRVRAEVGGTGKTPSELANEVRSFLSAAASITAPGPDGE